MNIIKNDYHSSISLLYRLQVDYPSEIILNATIINCQLLSNG